MDTVRIGLLNTAVLYSRNNFDPLIEILNRRKLPTHLKRPRHQRRLIRETGNKSEKVHLKQKKDFSIFKKMIKSRK